MYLGLTPDQIADHTATPDGLITNIDISGDIDQFDTWLHAFGNGLLDSGWWDGLFNSIVAFVYNAFASTTGSPGSDRSGTAAPGVIAHFEAEAAQCSRTVGSQL